MKEAKKMNIFINWSFFLYFLILFIERLESVIRIFIEGQEFAFLTFFRGFNLILVLASLIGALLLLIFINRDFFIGLFTNRVVDYKKLMLSVGVLLISGMIHTEFTILAIQFVSYGFLILALILQSVIAQKEAKHPSLLWISLIYLVSFSMAIPVVYESNLEGNALFHSLEIVIALFMILSFVYMADQLFLGKGEHLIYIYPFLMTLLGDIFLIVFRWNEYINVFLIIALIATIIFFIIGKVLDHYFKEKDKKE